MAINYNEDGMYLGYFETLGSLLAQYNGRRGNFAIVGNMVMVHNGQEWKSTTASSADVQDAINENKTAIDNLSTLIEQLTIAGTEMRWSYQSEIDSLADNPENWYTYPLEVSEDNQVVYFSTRFRSEDGEWSAWSIPTAFTRYIPKPKDGDSYQNIYYLSNYDNIADQLRFELLQLIVSPSYQNQNFVPDGWSVNVIQPTEQKPFVYLATRKQTNGVWGDYSKPVIAYTHIVGKDGVVNYEDTSKYIAQYLQTDEQWGAVLGRIDNIEEQEYVTTSTLKATAEEISADVSSIVDGKFQSAGWEVTSDGVTLYGDKVQIKSSKESSSYIALFDKDGFLNVNLIKTINSNYYNANGVLRASVNEDQDGMFRTYYAVDSEATNEAKLNPPKQLEIGWDNDTQSVLRLYNQDGTIKKALTMDGLINDPSFDKAENPDFYKLTYVDITPKGDWQELIIGQTYTGGKTYFKHKESGKLYSGTPANDGYLVTAILTAPGTKDYRTVYYYDNGVLTKTTKHFFSFPTAPDYDGTIKDPVIPET
jgi:hypothetical protein